jgi:hypothetical protein
MSSIVSGILRDSSGQLWTNAPIQVIFQPNQGAAGPYVWSGGNFNSMPPIFKTDSSGHFSTTLPANSEIVPAGSYWQFIIGPSATFPAVVLNLSLITGSLDISAQFSVKAPPAIIQSLFVPRAYSDPEVIVPPNSGQLYYDVTNKALKYYENGIWNSLATAAGAPVMVFPAVGIGVSTGNAWGTSIDPATVPRLNTPNIFTVPQTINSTLNVSGAIYCQEIDPGAGVFLKLNWVNGLGVEFGNGTSSPTQVASISNTGALFAASAVVSGIINASGGLLVPGDVWHTANIFPSTSQVVIGTASNQPIISWVSGGAPIDTRIYDQYVDTTGNMHFRTTSDNLAIANDWMTVYRNSGSTSASQIYYPIFAKCGAGFQVQGSDNINLAGQVLRFSYGTQDGYIDSIGNSSTRGTISLRGYANNGANGQTFLNLDSGGNVSFGGTFCNFGVNAPGGQTFGIATYDSPWSTAFPYIRSTTTGAITINPKPGGSLYINWDQGAGTIFGNGGGTQVASIDTAGKITTQGNIEASSSGSFISAGPITYSNAVGTAGSPAARLMLAVNGQGGVSYSSQFVVTTWSGPTPDGPGWAQDTMAIRNVNSPGGATGFIWKLQRNGHNQIQGAFVSTGWTGGVNGSVALGMQSDITYMDSCGSGGTRGSFNFRIMSAGSANLLTPLAIDANGVVTCNNGFNVTGGGKNFVIPHPLDETKSLVHSCIEGPEIAVFYRGEATTDENSRVQLFLPLYFESLTSPDGRTVLLTQKFEGDEQLSLLAASSISGGSFTVRSSIPTVKFYWEVKATRKDLAPLEVEPSKQQPKGE